MGVKAPIRTGILVALPTVVGDARCDYLCRMGMLAAALLHWVAAALILWPVTDHASWNYTGARERARICSISTPQSPDSGPTALLDRP
jgi:hypothetical protein